MSKQQRRGVHVAILIGVVALVYVLVFVGGEARRYWSDGVLDLRFFGYDLNSVATSFERAGPEGRGFYKGFLLVDALFIPIYTACGLTIIWVTLGRFAPGWRWKASSLAVVTAAVDYLEDFLNWMNLASFPALDPAIVELASRVTIAKWLIVAATVGVIVLGLVRTREELFATGR